MARDVSVVPELEQVQVELTVNSFARPGTFKDSEPGRCETLSVTVDNGRVQGLFLCFT